MRSDVPGRATAAYVICATPRSGSTLLCDLLAASGVAGQPHSYLRAQDIGYWANLWSIPGSTGAADPAFNHAYFAAMVRAGAADTGMFGLRLMWESVGEATERLDAAFGGAADIASGFAQAFGPTLFIHLSRHDKTAQAVSLVRAGQTGLWHVAADGAERERTAPAQPPVFDAGRIARTQDMLAAHDAEWCSFFARRRIDPLRLTFEELAADPRQTVARTLAALGRDPAIAASIAVRTARMADAVNAEWVARMQSA